jgi:mRNA-degrading endonuclease RelE of RelBE toxin-antitoxin system
MSYRLEFSKTALEDIEKYKKSGDKPTLRKIQKLLNGTPNKRNWST